MWKSDEVWAFTDTLETPILCLSIEINSVVCGMNNPCTTYDRVLSCPEGEEEEEESTFQKGHLTKLLMEPMSADLQLLQYNKVSRLHIPDHRGVVLMTVA